MSTLCEGLRCEHIFEESCSSECHYPNDPSPLFLWVVIVAVVILAGGALLTMMHILGGKH